MKSLFPILLLYGLFAGCAAVPLLPLVSPFLSGQQPQAATTTSVQLATKNYKIVKTNVVGTSWGFSFLGFISLTSPDYAEAMAQLYSHREAVITKVDRHLAYALLSTYNSLGPTSGQLPCLW
jgi:hypothetical protein